MKLDSTEGAIMASGRGWRRPGVLLVSWKKWITVFEHSNVRTLVFRSYLPPQGGTRHPSYYQFLLRGGFASWRTRMVRQAGQNEMPAV